MTFDLQEPGKFNKSMRRWTALVAWLSMAAAATAASTNTVHFQLFKFTNRTTTNRTVTSTPLALYPGLGQQAVYDRVQFTTSANGEFWSSNMMYGLYQIVVEAPPDRTTFKIHTPATNAVGVLEADAIMVAATNAASSPQSYAYSMQASDARYTPIGGVVAANLSPWNTNINANTFSLSNATAVQATAFYGDGAGLTGISGGVTNGATVTNIHFRGTASAGSAATNVVDLQTVVSGTTNGALADNAIVIGGYTNTATGVGSIILGGHDNVATGRGNVILGGLLNRVYGIHSFVGPGSSTSYGLLIGSNVDGSVIVNGVDNSIDHGQNSFIGDGNDSHISGNHSFIGAGDNQLLLANYSIIGGGEWNQVGAGFDSTQTNDEQTTRSGVFSGDHNLVIGHYSAILGGSHNSVEANQSAILGGSGNTVTGTNSFAIGSGLSVIESNMTVVQNLRATGKLYGDGSSLTGVSATAGNWVVQLGTNATGGPILTNVDIYNGPSSLRVSYTETANTSNLWVTGCGVTAANGLYTYASQHPDNLFGDPIYVYTSTNGYGAEFDIMQTLSYLPATYGTPEAKCIVITNSSGAAIRCSAAVAGVAICVTLSAFTNSAWAEQAGETICGSTNYTASGLALLGSVLGNGSGLTNISYFGLTNYPVPSGSFNALYKAPPMMWSTYTSGVEPTASNILAVASNLISSGMWQAGYRNIQIDEKWGWRTNATTITVDPTNFPDGLKVVVDQLHAMQFKVGLYYVLKAYGNWDAGPGSMHPMSCRELMRSDAADAFGTWGFDWIKWDGYLDGSDLKTAREVSRAYYDQGYNDKGMNLTLHGTADFSPYTMHPDIPSFSPLFEWTVLQDKVGVSNFVWIADQLEPASKYNGPGHWGQFVWQKADTNAMAFNAVWPSPLYAGISSFADVSLWTNKEVLAINQDVTGTHSVLYSNGFSRIWGKPLVAQQYAVLFINGTSAGSSNLSLTASMLGYATNTTFRVRDPWAQAWLDNSTDPYTVAVATNASRLLVFSLIDTNASTGTGGATLAGTNTWTGTNTYTQPTVFSNTVSFYGDAEFFGASGMVATNATFNGQTNLGKIYFDGGSGNWPYLVGVAGGKIKVFDTDGTDGSIDAEKFLATGPTGFQGDGQQITNIPASAIQNGAITNGHSGPVTLNGITNIGNFTNTGTIVAGGALTAVSGSFSGASISGGNVYSASGNYFGASTRSGFISPANGRLRAVAYSGGDLSRFTFGQELAGYPAFVMQSNAVATLDLTTGTGSGTANFNVSGTLTASNGIVLPGTNAVIKFVANSNTNGPTLGANLAYIFAGSNGTAGAEIYVMDGGGTITLISPHSQEAPPEIYDDDDPFPNVEREANYYLGKIRWSNRSRAAKQQELLTKVTLNSMANWMFLQGKSATQWSNSAAYGKYTNALVKLDELSETSRQLVVNETFAEYAARTGVALQQVSWSSVQTLASNEVYAAYQKAQLDYANAVTAYLTELDAGNTNAVAPVEPGPYVPRVAEPVPQWLYKRGVR